MRRVSQATAFNPANATVDASGIGGFSPHLVLGIFDTTDPHRATLYDFATPGLDFAGVSGNVMTVSYDTSALSSSDNILIVWDDGLSSSPSSESSLGYDSSVNRPGPLTFPSGSPAYFGSGVWTSWVYGGLVAANPNRERIDLINLSEDQILVVRHDGTVSTPGATLHNASVFLLNPVTPTGPKDVYSSLTFKGAFLFYAPPGVSLIVSSLED
jgi:hypothetical protein